MVRALADRYRPWWIIAVVVLSVLLPAAGSSVAGPTPGPQLVGTVDLPGVQFAAATGDLVYVVRTDERSELYRVDERVHRILTQRRAFPLTLAPDIAVTLAACADRDAKVTVIDMTSGRIRWERVGAAWWQAGRLMVQEHVADRDCPPVPEGGVQARAPDGTGPAALDVVEVDSGRILWTLPTPAIGPTLVDGAEPSLVGIGTDGRWFRRDLRTGAGRGPTNVAAPPAPPADLLGGAVSPSGVESPMYRTLSAVAGVITILNIRDSTVVIQAADAATFSPLWTTKLDTALQPPLRCGRLLCLADGYGTRAIRPDTGEEVWRLPWAIVSLVGSRWAVMLPDQDQIAPFPRTRLVDLVTGRQVDDLSGWRAATVGPGAQLDPAARVVLFRYARGRTWFARLDPEQHGSTLRVLGSVPDVRAACTAGDRHVFCFGGGTMRAWRLPDAAAG